MIKIAVKDLVKLQVWRLRTPSQMVFNDFRERFRNTKFLVARTAVRTAIFCKIFQWLFASCVYSLKYLTKIYRFDTQELSSQKVLGKIVVRCSS